MEHQFKYIIVGGGMAAASAVEGIRERDANGSIGLFSKESVPPYNRPPLTKGLWQKGEPDKDDIWRETGRYENVDMFLENSIVEIDRENRFVLDEESSKFHYEKLLLATGGNAWFWLYAGGPISR